MRSVTRTSIAYLGEFAISNPEITQSVGVPLKFSISTILLCLLEAPGLFKRTCAPGIAYARNLPDAMEEIPEDSCGVALPHRCDAMHSRADMRLTARRHRRQHRWISRETC